MNEKILWYIADPMCSWCWGFAPVMKAVKLNYSELLKVNLMLGGLRPWTKQAMISEQRERILSHWNAVNEKTGQPFTFEGAMPEGFIYDTEPSCRAVVTVSLINPDLVFLLFEAIQFSFYVEQKDVTNPKILAQLANNVGINSELFLQVFESEEAKKQVSAHFDKVLQWGINCFPTVAVQNQTGYSILNKGYCSVSILCKKLDTWLYT